MYNYTMNTTEKVLKTIKKDKLRPRSVLFFALKHIAIWFILALTVFIGAFVFSAFLFRLLNAGFEHIGFITSSHFYFILSLFPFSWLLLLIASAVIAHTVFRDTERGHMPSWQTVTLVNILISLFIGSMLFFFGFGYVGERLVFHYKGMDVEHAYLMRWNNPEEGRIAGIASVIDNNTILLTDVDGVGHTVVISGLGMATVSTSTPIRVIGTLTEDGNFYACQILPVRFRGAFSREERIFQRVNEIKAEDERTTLCRDVPTTDY